MSTTEAAILKHMEENKWRRVLHALEAWMRKSHLLYTKNQGDRIPDYDLRLTVPLSPAQGQSFAEFITEHMEAILSLLPDTVAVVDRRALESLLGMVAPDAGGRADPLVGKVLSQTLERNAQLIVRGQAHIAEMKRREYS